MRIILGPDQPIIDSIRDAAARHERGRARIAVAWAREEGVRWLLDAIAGRLQELEVIVGLNERGTTVEALLRLLPAASFLAAFYKHPRQTFHPKLYLFDDGGREPCAATVIVGSSNLTRGGLVTNVEASLIAERAGGDQTAASLLASALAAWDNLSRSPFTIPITEQRIRELYEGGYLSTEAALRRQRREAIRHQTPRRDIRTAPPPPVRPPAAEPLVFPFPVDAVQEQQVPSEDVDPAWTVPVPDRFFVRTLTRNDVEKLHGRTPGTFEPDLGETARDRFPAFWGWPDRYETVVRQQARREWRAQALLFSSETPPEGVQVEAMLWYREERPGHAAEHRLRLGPRGTLRGATPRSFDTTSLLVIERASGGLGYDFVVRLVVRGEPEYDALSRHLNEQRPNHHFGYGP